MPEVPLTDQTRAEAIGWLVSTVGRDFMLEQVERAERAENCAEIAAQLRDWTERLATVGGASAMRMSRIRRGADALHGSTLGGTLNVDRAMAEEIALAVLKGAGVIR